MAISLIGDLKKKKIENKELSSLLQTFNGRKDELLPEYSRVKKSQNCIKGEG